MLQTRRHQTAEPVVGKRRLLVIADPMPDEEGNVSGAVYILSDITEHRRLEEQLRQSQKMEALGRLAGGIAHDFNNLLTAVSGNVSLLLTGMPLGDPTRDALLATDQAVWRAVDLTRQLLDFARASAVRPQPLDLRTCLDEVASLLRRTIGRTITLEVHSDTDLWTIQADPGRINQVLMNLCLNARDALPEGGLLLLEAENVVVEEGRSQLSDEARPGAFVRLRVLDTGEGIAPEVLPHLFEPFFTTKEPGKGTGLGLATVFSIVARHQGWIECFSAVHQGTCFDVYLPRITADEGPGPAAPSTSVLPGTQTVLLVDSDAVGRALGRLLLRHSGYKVLAVENGEEAADLYQREHDRIGLVILDLNVSRPAWRDTLGRLLQVDPQVRVLLAGSSSEETTEPEPVGVRGFLTKPYRSANLLPAIRRALEPGEDDPPGNRSEPPAPPAGPGPVAEPGQPEKAPSTTEESQPTGEESRSGLSKAEAEELLDSLEAHGYQGHVLFSEGEAGFTVSWQQAALAAHDPLRYHRRSCPPCPACGSTEKPYRVREMVLLSWVLVGFGLVLWPLLPLGLALRQDVWRCWNCRHVLGRSRLSLGW
jgi:signal transduction histidine kinase/CheY-like chemotaxis protein